MRQREEILEDDPPVKWRNRVQEYVRKRGERSLRNFKQARREYLDRECWKLMAWPSPGGSS